MNALQRFAVRAAARIAPPLRGYLEASGVRIERLSEAVQLYREAEAARNAPIQERICELREAIAMQAGPWQPAITVRESASSGAVVKVKERLAELELALEDRGWKRMLALADLEFSRWGIQQIILICRLYRIKNPLIQRGILVSCYYVFGRSFTVSSGDDATKQLLDSFFDNPKNQSELGQNALMQKHAAKWTDGNIFWCFFSDPDTGETLVRSIDPIEIEEIITDPDDASQEWYFRRAWNSTTFDPVTGTTQPVRRQAWYVAEDYDPPLGLKTIKDADIVIEPNGDYVRVLHRKCGALEKWHFGCPRAYAAIDWARAYRKTLENYSSILEALARFAWTAETKGGAPAIAALKQELATTLANDGTSVEQNPTPVTGSTWISGPGTKITPVKTAGYAPSPEDARRLAHMVYMVFGLPEHFFADISTGNLATATSLDRPTELMFVQEQEEWKEDLAKIGRIACMRSKKAPSGKLKEAAIASQADVQIDVSFPSIREGDLAQNVAAVVEAITLNGFEPTGIDERTGVRILLNLVASVADFDIDIEDLIGKMYPDNAAGDGEGYKIDRTVPAPAPNPNNTPPDPNEGPAGAPPKPTGYRKPHAKHANPKEAGLTRAVIELRAALARLKG